MSIENETFRLLPHELSTDAAGQLYIERLKRVTLVPDTFRELLTMAREGTPIAQMTERLRRAACPLRFALVAKFLGFLYDHDLIADRGMIHLAEALKSETRWPESIAFEPLFKLELFSLAQAKARPALATGFAFCLFAGGILGLPFLFRQSTLAADVAPMRMALASLLGFLFTVGLGRSLKSICKAIGSHWATGESSSVTLSVDAVSVSLGTDDLSRGLVNLPLLMVGLAAAFWSLAPGWVVRLSWMRGSINPQIGAVVPILAMFLFLLDLSPFVRSDGTDILRTLYNFWDRGSLGRGEKQLEGRIRLIHLASKVVWLAALIGFFVTAYLPFVIEFWRNLDLKLRSDQVFGGLFFLTQLVIWISIADEILGSISDDHRAPSRRVRQMFVRKSQTHAVDDRIQRGQMPSRADLEKLPILRQMDPETRGRLLGHSEVFDRDEGQAACRQDETDRTLFVVLSGRFAVAKRTASSSRRKVVAFLEPGAVFGEAAFFFGSPRTADVVALEDSRVLAIHHDETMKTLDTSRSEEMQTRIWFLQSLVSGSFLKDLPSEALDALIIAGRKKLFRAGEKPIQEGERGDACYFIIQGKASVTQNTVLINQLHAGDAFGEIALLREGTLRTASVVATSDLLTMTIDGERFWVLLESHLPLALEIERLAEKRLKNDQRRDTQVSSSRVQS